MNILCVSVISLVLFGLPVCRVFAILGRPGSPSVPMEHVFVMVNRLATDGFSRGILGATPHCHPRPDLTTPPESRQP